MNTADLIVDLARELGVGDEALKKWKRRPYGVPHRWRLPILDKAAERGVALPREALDQFPRQPAPSDKAA